MRRALVPVAGILLGLACAYQSWPGMEPPSFWLDDLWVATLAKHGTLADFLRLKPPAPFGFLALLKGIAFVLGPGEWQLQSVSFVARILSIPIIVLLVDRLTGKAFFAIAAGAIFAVHPVLAEFSIRAKQFSLDVLITLTILWLATSCLKDRSPKRLAYLCACVLVSMIFSFPAAFTGPLLANLIAVDLLINERPTRHRVLAVMTAFNGFVLFIGLALLRGSSSPEIRDYWKDNFIPLGWPHMAFEYLWNGAGWRFLTAVFQHEATLGALLVLVGIVAMLAGRERRVFGVFLILFYVEMIAASALKLFPLGEARIDLFSWPIAVVAACMGGAFLVRDIPVLTAVASVAAIAFAVQVQVDDRVHYRKAGEQQIVRSTVKAVGNDVPLVVFPWGNWAIGYYGPWPVDLIPARDSTNQFYAIPRRDRTLVLRESNEGVDFRANRMVVARELASFVTKAGPRIVYFGAHGDHEIVLSALRTFGYQEKSRESEASAAMVVMEKPTPGPTP